MSFAGGLKRLLGRDKPAPVIDPPGYRGVATRRATPPPPPPPAPVVDAPPPSRPSTPQVRLMMADGTIEELPADPALEERAAYLIRSMLSPAPPPPPA